MTGLDKILEQISADATASANDIIAQANTKAEKIIDSARAEAQKQASGVIAQGEAKSKELKQRADSAALLEKRNKMLTFKQQYIDKLIEETCSSMENAPDNEYFENLLALFKIYARKDNGVMQLNAKDLNRMPSDFISKVKAVSGHEITLSEQPCDISGGFLLLYEGIDINCSFKAIFEDKTDALRDIAREVLFPENN